MFPIQFFQQKSLDCSRFLETSTWKLNSAYSEHDVENMSALLAEVSAASLKIVHRTVTALISMRKHRLENCVRFIANRISTRAIRDTRFSMLRVEIRR